MADGDLHAVSVERKMSEATAAAVGWAGTAAALGLFLSPTKDVFGNKGIRRTRSTARLATGLPYFATFFNCLYWVAYLGPNASEFVPAFTVNAIGTALNASFAWVYYAHATVQERELCRRWLGVGTSFLVCLVFGAFVFSNIEIVGCGAAVMNVGMYYAPLAAVSTVVRSRSVEKMPFLPLVMAFVSGVLWMTYGFLVDKIPIIVPTLIGVCLSAIQVSIWFWFYCAGSAATDPTTSPRVEDVNEEEPPESFDLAASPFVRRPSEGSKSSILDLADDEMETV